MADCYSSVNEPVVEHEQNKVPLLPRITEKVLNRFWNKVHKEAGDVRWSIKLPLGGGEEQCELQYLLNAGKSLGSFARIRLGSTSHGMGVIWWMFPKTFRDRRPRQWLWRY